MSAGILFGDRVESEEGRMMLQIATDRTFGKLIYAPAVVAALGVNLWVAFYDMESMLSLAPLSVTLVAPISAMMIGRRRVFVVVVAILFQFGFVILGGFTIGRAYLLSAALLLAGGVIELVAVRRSDAG